MPLARKNGVTLHLQELGDAGPPVVMLHGLFIGSLVTWYFTAAPLLAKTHKVLVYDLRGHGKSERAKTGYDLGTMCADLRAVVSDFTDAKVTLVGHSYGAVVALRYAIDHPEHVEKVALVEAPLPPSRLEELEAFVGKSPEEMAGALPDALRDAVARQGRQAAKLVESLRFLALESSLVSDLRDARDIDDAELRTVMCPTLCVYGSRSSCRGVGDRLVRALPCARLVVLEGGHFLPVEAPHALGAALREFVHG